MTHQYIPLPEDGQSIRLLRLLPAPDIVSPIHCELFHTQINSPSQSAYEVLSYTWSYTWGDPSVTTPITLSGSTFQATTNLAAALRALRSADHTRMLWVDAMCINQADLREQGS